MRAIIVSFRFVMLGVAFCRGESSAVMGAGMVFCGSGPGASPKVCPIPSTTPACFQGFQTAQSLSWPVVGQGKNAASAEGSSLDEKARDLVDIRTIELKAALPLNRTVQNQTAHRL